MSIVRHIGNRNTRRFGLIIVVPLVTLIVMVLVTGCTTRTTGMQAPLGHDYDGLSWMPLNDEVAQRIVVAPGYTALVENDPGTQEDDLVARIERLPDDVRSSTLEEVRLAVRPVEDRSFDPTLSVEIGIEGTSEPVLVNFDELHFDGDWIVIPDPPSAVAGQTLVVRLKPAPGWQYGMTPNRAPYGGSVASSGPVDQEQPLSGSLGFQTVFAQQTEAGEIASLWFDTALPSILTDPVLLISYAIILIGGAVLAVGRLRKMGAV